MGLKINLECGTNIRNGYINVNSFPSIDINTQQNDANFIIGNYRDINSILANNQASEIVFNPPLNILKPTELVGILFSWLSKLNSGGNLKLWFIDVRKAARDIYYNNIQLESAHALLLGNGNNFQSILDVDVIKNLLVELKVTNTIISFNNSYVSLEITKS